MCACHQFVRLILLIDSHPLFLLSFVVPSNDSKVDIIVASFDSLSLPSLIDAESFWSNASSSSKELTPPSPGLDIAVRKEDIPLFLKLGCYVAFGEFYYFCSSSHSHSRDADAPCNRISLSMQKLTFENRIGFNKMSFKN